MSRPQETVAPQRNRVILQGVGFDPFHQEDVVSHVLRELANGRGGRIITPNVDILRQVGSDAESREHVESATVVVADGKPLIWASRIGGSPLPERVAGSDLIWSLSAAMARHRRSVYLLGGEPGAAEQAARVLGQRHPRLTVAGHLSPAWGFDRRPGDYAAMCDAVVAANPDLVFVGLGFPKQERVISRLRPLLPRAWFMGCGAAIGFVAGTHRRAPRWMRDTGLEWVHRLLVEPRRLVRRYLLHDAPFAVRLLGGSGITRLRRGAARDAKGNP